MSGWRQVMLVARRDFVQRARSRAFLATMLVIIGAVVIGGPLIADLGAPEPQRDVGYVGTPSPVFSAALQATSEQVGIEPTVTEYADRASAESALAEERIDVLVVPTPPPGTLVWQSGEDPSLASAVGSGLRADEQSRQAEQLGLREDEAAALVAPAPPASEVVDEVDPDEQARQVASFVGMLLLYLAVVLFGQFVMLGVVEEKSSRVVEVVLSRVMPYRLLAGKVLGIGALAVVQIVALAAAGYVAARLATSVEDVTVPLDLIASILFWFLVGFAFFAVLYAALGATVTRQEDVQSVALIPLVLVLPAYFIGIIALNDPELPVVRVTSLIPPLSPFVMPIRSASGDVPFWEIAVSVALLVAATYGMIRLAGRIYTGAILSIGRKVSLRDAWRSSAHVPAE